ncbi:Two component system, signal transduction histidine kinase [Acididesulfobacillus acetoxydans]|uniref:histidine kinase n=1 Tax=Acididesulfobacillus acetoxydans TaxID=1561005 RepID=A0A8S0XBT8_9FIRM|nr:ATP-binding protein [Acididesulfobacillus acetoxydans]CAA7601606.1 Two component system, signal transduction histidine kinase [Acididesulfobacillus acetoxydans]CEJ07093.1 Signal transduction histidine-protein kinase AtoS [Acididesulfobacillus acetoxydans]
MKYRFSLILAIFLLVVIPIFVTGFFSMQTADKALQLTALQAGVSLSPNDMQVQRLRENVIYLLIIGTVVSITGAGIFVSELAGSVQTIQRGLDDLGHNLVTTIKPMHGVMGEISASINRMASRLREAQTHRDALLVNSPNGIITVDASGKIVLFNPAAAFLTGIEQTAALSLNYLQAGFSESLQTLIHTLLQQEETVRAKETLYTRPDGTSIAMAVTGSRLFDMQNRLIGVLLVMIDLREKRLLEEQVLRASRLAALGELASGVAHEIRNPLTAVKGYTQLLDEELPAGDEKHEYTSVIEKEVWRLDRLVQELLAFARPAASRFQPVDLNAAIDETLVLIDNRALREHIELIRDFGEHIVVEADREQIKQILLNLLLNAIQAITEQGTIYLSTRRYDEEAIVRIIDSGTGIMPEHMGELFNPFFTTKEQGTGLGLAIVHQLVELHHGHIQVRSAPERGAAFEIHLPLRQNG